MSQRADVVVIGGGVIGCAAAYSLARRGVKTSLIEQHRVGHSLGSSHGPSRIIRLAYDGADYVALARASYDAWRALEVESKEELLVPTGGLDMGTPDAFALDGIQQTYEATGVPFELLDRDEIVHRFPQLNPPDETIALYQADYALLAADRCVAALARLATEAGVTILDETRVAAISSTSGGVRLVTTDGEVQADRTIVAAGSWIGDLLRPTGLDLPLSILKEQLAFFTAARPADYAPGRLPLVIHRFPDTTSLGSVFPIFHHAGVKIMIDRIGPVVDAIDLDRTIDQESLARLRAYATELLPGLTGEVIEAVSCRYTMTPDEDFILDRHPASERIVIASSCSGHGFKFAPVLGDVAADLALTGTTAHDIGRFRLDRFEPIVRH